MATDEEQDAQIEAAIREYEAHKSLEALVEEIQSSLRYDTYGKLEQMEQETRAFIEGPSEPGEDLLPRVQLLSARVLVLIAEWRRMLASFESATR